MLLWLPATWSVSVGSVSPSPSLGVKVAVAPIRGDAWSYSAADPDQQLSARVKTFVSRQRLLRKAVLRHSGGPQDPAPVSTSVPTEHRLLKMALFNVRSLSNKTFIVNDFISYTDLGFMFLTESCLQAGDYSKIVELCPPDFDCFSQPRIGGWGSGLVTVFTKHLKCNLLPCNAFSNCCCLNLGVHCRLHLL